jgi:hypothetical protein
VTTETSSRCSPSASIVSTKFVPPVPNSHAVRTIAWAAVAAATACSPASFVSP